MTSSLGGRRFSTANQKPPFSEDFSEDLPKTFRNALHQSEARIQLRKIWSQGSHSTTVVVVVVVVVEEIVVAVVVE